jgi:hypothetical protein
MLGQTFDELPVTDHACKQPSVHPGDELQDVGSLSVMCKMQQPLISSLTHALLQKWPIQQLGLLAD